MISAAIDWSDPAQARSMLAKLEGASSDAAAHRWMSQNLEHGFTRGNPIAQLGNRQSVLRTQWHHLRLVADARIDNRPELWQQLKGAPYLHEYFDDNTAILAAYARWGARCAEHLIGDFAFVLFDEQRQRVFAACDGMNMRTLHFAPHAQGLCLATEAAQLLRLPFISKNLSKRALALWVKGFPDPCLSMYADIHRLRPGHSLCADHEGTQLTRFWDLDPGKHIRLANKKEYSDQLLELLGRAVSDRMPRDNTGVATQMSGGMDSTSITALTAQHSASAGNPLAVISHRYADGSAQDESSLIDETRTHLNLPNHHWVSANEHLQLPYAELYPPHPDSPGTLLSPRYHSDMQIAQAQGASVLLTGSGGDEMCWGHALSYSKRLRRGDMSAVIEVVKGAREHELPLRKTLQSLFIAPLVPQRVRAALRRSQGKASSPAWLTKLAMEHLGLDEHIAEHSADPDISDQLFVARYNALKWSSTIHSVRSHAAVGRKYGIDVSHPFYDQRVAEFSFAIPDELWLREGQSKWLLRQAVKPLLPASLVNAQQKTTFTSYFGEHISQHQTEINAILRHPLIFDLELADRGTLLKGLKHVVSRPETLRVELLFALQLQGWISAVAPE